MSKILIDTGKINDPFVGLGQVSEQYAQAILTDEDPNADWEFYFALKSGEKVPAIFTHKHIYNLRAAGRYFPRVNKGFDLWHSIHQDSDWVPASDTPFVLTIHDFNFLYEKGELKSGIRLNRIGAKIHKATAITTISEFTSNELMNYFPEIKDKVRVVYNGVNPPQIHQAQKPPGFPFEDPYLFCICYFSPKKNLESLIYMMERMPDKHLVLAGDHENAYGQKLQKLVQEIKLDNIYFAGKVNAFEKSWLFQHSESLVFPSLYEGFGLPVIEALHLGKPVVTSAHTALPEIGGGHTGIWAHFDPDYMKTVYQAYISNDSETLQEGRKQYASGFSWNAHLKQMKSLYHEILTKI